MLEEHAIYWTQPGLSHRFSVTFAELMTLKVSCVMQTGQTEQSTLHASLEMLSFFELCKCTVHVEICTTNAEDICESYTFLAQLTVQKPKILIQ